MGHFPFLQHNDEQEANGIAVDRKRAIGWKRAQPEIREY
jgi:hypothetical protein